MFLKIDNISLRGPLAVLIGQFCFQNGFLIELNVNFLLSLRKLNFLIYNKIFTSSGTVTSFGSKLIGNFQVFIYFDKLNAE